MDPIERIDIDRFDAWLDQMTQGIANSAPDDAADLASAATWLHEKGQKTMSSTSYGRQFESNLRPALGRGIEPTMITPRPHVRTTADASGHQLRALMVAAAALLIAVPAIILLARSFNGGPDDPTIPAPMSGLAQSGASVTCSVQQPSTLAISGTPEHEALLQQNTLVPDPGHPGDGAIAINEQDLPTGSPASEVDLANIQHMLSILAACIHAGDFVSTDALYSDDSFRRVGASRIVDAQPSPTSLQLPAEIVTPVILSSNVLPDGRIGVLIAQDLWGYGLQEYFILVHSEERGWLVDEVSPVAPLESVASPAAMTAITVIATDLTFSPNSLVIPANTNVTLTVKNEGLVPHSFTMLELDIDVRVEPGQSKDITLNLAPGTYDFKSTVANQGAFMHGTLTAEQSSSASIS